MQAAAEKNFLTLMAKMARDKDSSDFTLVCEGARRPTNSFILRNLQFLTATPSNVVLAISLFQEQVAIL